MIFGQTFFLISNVNKCIDIYRVKYFYLQLNIKLAQNIQKLRNMALLREVIMYSKYIICCAIVI